MRDICKTLVGHLVFSKLNILQKNHVWGIVCYVTKYSFSSLVHIFITGIGVW